MNHSFAYPARQQTLADVPAHQVVFLLFSRFLFFAGFQALFAGIFFLLGYSSAWAQSTSWWTICAALGSATSLVILEGYKRMSGGRYLDLWRTEPGTRRKDILFVAGLWVLAGPITFIPNLWLGRVLFGSSGAAASLMVADLPRWAAAAQLVAFPILVGMTELLTYFGLAMPLVEKRVKKAWLAVGISATFLAFQHCALPLRFDARFFAYRFLMFLPFAMMLGIVLRWRPRLLPYLMVAHMLIDLLTAVSVLLPPAA